MAHETQKHGDTASISPQASEGEKKINCGLIMPISATANQTEHHWNDVQRLLHRSIANAGFVPFNVWLNETTDRISERIVGNIFNHEVVVADISDLNPNVMLELGLRLSSRKPTVVIVNKGGSIPFDIRDFEVLDYPADLNILAMEIFFKRFEDALRAKYKAFLDGKYVPFLGSIVVDVLAPKVRPVEVDELVLSRIDDLSARFQRLEQSVMVKRPSVSPSRPVATRYTMKIPGGDRALASKIVKIINVETPLASMHSGSGDDYVELTIIAPNSAAGDNIHVAMRNILTSANIDPASVTLLQID